VHLLPKVMRLLEELGGVSGNILRNDDFVKGNSYDVRLLFYKNICNVSIGLKRCHQLLGSGCGQISCRTPSTVNPMIFMN